MNNKIKQILYSVVNDTRALLQIIAMLFHYWTAGRKMRRDLKRCEDNGEIYWLDDQPTKGNKP